MCAKNFLMDMNYTQIKNEYSDIINQFKVASKNGIDTVSIAYLLNNLDIDQDILYDKIHEMLELEILDVIEYTSCPYCLYEQKVMNYSNNIKCDRCKKYYEIDDILEKFIIKKDFLNG